MQDSVADRIVNSQLQAKIEELEKKLAESKERNEFFKTEFDKNAKVINDLQAWQKEQEEKLAVKEQPEESKKVKP